MHGGRDDNTMSHRPQAPTLYWQAIVAGIFVLLQQGVGCRICVTARSPDRPRREAMYSKGEFGCSEFPGNSKGIPVAFTWKFLGDSGQFLGFLWVGFLGFLWVGFGRFRVSRDFLRKFLFSRADWEVVWGRW